MRTVFGFGMAAVLAAGCGQAKQREGKKPDAKAETLDGAWRIVALEREGMKELEINLGTEEEQTFRFAGGKMTHARQEPQVTVKLDPSKSPKQITFTETEAGEKRRTRVGIYKLDDDTLTICDVESEKEADRPTAFKTVKGSPAALLTLKRRKDE
ncbi:MAG: hypothetical protein C0501_28945 [Isosphaera sp.]|nr:hypothetical protein [Isosphaera sp.]